MSQPYNPHYTWGGRPYLTYYNPGQHRNNHNGGECPRQRYEAERLLPNRNFAKDHSYEEWLVEVG